MSTKHQTPNFDKREFTYFLLNNHYLSDLRLRAITGLIWTKCCIAVADIDLVTVLAAEICINYYFITDISEDHAYL